MLGPLVSGTKMNQENALTATKDFEQWATRFSGCDGGNPDGGYWFCGIEWSEDYSESDLKRYLEKDVFQGDADLPEPFENTQEGYEKVLRERYNQNALKIYSAIKFNDFNQYENLRKKEGFTPFSAGSDLFKLNLYPIGFNADENKRWREEYFYALTGLASKTLYRAWCQAHRFPVFRAAVVKYRPKVIIGTSRNYLDEYAMAFAGEGHAYFEATKQLGEHEEIIQERKINWTLIDDGQTLLVVTPFLGGPRGLSSNKQLQHVGEFIADLIRKR